MFELNKTGHRFVLPCDHQSVTSVLENENLCEKSRYLIFFWGGYVFPFMVL